MVRVWKTSVRHPEGRGSADDDDLTVRVHDAVGRDLSVVQYLCEREPS